MFVVFSLAGHHAGYAAQVDSQAPAAHVEMRAVHHCPVEGCPSHHDGQVSCCALGHCSVPLPAYDDASALMAPGSAYPRHSFEIALRWGNARVDRPPKSS